MREWFRCDTSGLSQRVLLQLATEFTSLVDENITSEFFEGSEGRSNTCVALVCADAQVLKVRSCPRGLNAYFTVYSTLAAINSKASRTVVARRLWVVLA